MDKTSTNARTFDLLNLLDVKSLLLMAINRFMEFILIKVLFYCLKSKHTIDLDFIYFLSFPIVSLGFRLCPIYAHFGSISNHKNIKIQFHILKFHSLNRTKDGFVFHIERKEMLA